MNSLFRLMSQPLETLVGSQFSFSAPQSPHEMTLAHQMMYLSSRCSSSFRKKPAPLSVVPGEVGGRFVGGRFSVIGLVAAVLIGLLIIS